MKKIIILICLCFSAGLSVNAQSNEWIFSPNLHMNTTTGAFTTIPASSDFASCIYTNQRLGVCSNTLSGLPEDYIAFNSCGLYKANGDSRKPGGVGNLFGLPGSCHTFYSVGWTRGDQAPHGQQDMFILYELDATDRDTIKQVSQQVLIAPMAIFSNTNEAVGPLGTYGRRYIYAADDNNISVFHISVYGNIYPDYTIPLSGIGPLDNDVKMEVSPDGNSLFMVTQTQNVYRYDLVAGTFNLVKSLPANTVAGMEFVPAVVSGSTYDRLYISYHSTNPTVIIGDLIYVEFDPSGPTTHTGFLPSTVSAYQCGFSEIELAKNGLLYFGYNPAPASSGIIPTGSLYTLDPATGTASEVHLSGGAAIPLTNIEQGSGYLIQTQIDGDDYNYACADGCNSDFTITYNTNNPQDVIFTPADHTNSNTYEWTFSGGVGLVPNPPPHNPVNITFPSGGGGYSATLKVTDPPNPWNECFTQANFCLPADPMVSAGDPSLGAGNCSGPPEFKIEDNGKYLTLVPSTGGSYYNIEWGDGQSTFDPVVSAGAIYKHYYTNPSLPFLSSVPGTYTVCLQTGYGSGNCRKCMDVCVNYRTLGAQVEDHPRPAPAATSVPVANTITREGFYFGSIYPNPIKDKVSIEVIAAQNEQVSLQLTEITGKKVLERDYQLYKGRNKLEISLSGVSSGIYLIEMKGKKQSVRAKVVKD